MWFVESNIVPLNRERRYASAGGVFAHNRLAEITFLALYDAFGGLRRDPGIPTLRCG